MLLFVRVLILIVGMCLGMHLDIDMCIGLYLGVGLSVGLGCGAELRVGLGNIIGFRLNASLRVRV